MVSRACFALPWTSRPLDLRFLCHALCVARFFANLSSSSSTDIEISIFATGQRTASKLLKLIDKMLKKLFSFIGGDDFKVIQQNKEQIVLLGPDGTERVCGCYPGSVTVSNSCLFFVCTGGFLLGGRGESGTAMEATPPGKLSMCPLKCLYSPHAAHSEAVAQQRPTWTQEYEGHRDGPSRLCLDLDLKRATGCLELLRGDSERLDCLSAIQHCPNAVPQRPLNRVQCLLDALYLPHGTTLTSKGEKII